jgi:hypothetical protein
MSAQKKKKVITDRKLGRDSSNDLADRYLLAYINNFFYRDDKIKKTVKF